jgi:ankyrin repeat protein
MFSRQEFLARKKIEPNIFDELIKHPITHLMEHSRFAFNHFYSKPYLTPQITKSDFTRPHHGITHANRVAIYTGVFANLYRKYDDKEALELTNDEVNLLQITALLHDACRENDDEDHWDQDSATLVYLYLIAIGVAREKAILLAEALANKDSTDHYDKLTVHPDGMLSWDRIKAQKKNIYQKIIHDSDCLDIIRARGHFKAQKLDFYQEIAEKNSEAFEVMAQLIVDSRHLIETHGDSFQVKNNNRKLKFEQEMGLLYVIDALQDLKDYRVIYEFFVRPHTSPHSLDENPLLDKKSLKYISLIDQTKYQPEKKLTEENMRGALREGNLFARGLVSPSATSAKLRTFNDGTTQQESLASLEIRKIARSIGIDTSSSKENRNQKKGNPNRSISMLGNGYQTFAPVGFLKRILKPELDNITSIKSIDSDSGWQKKSNFQNHARILTKEKKEKKLKKLHRLSKMGGSSRVYYTFAATHNEITFNLDSVDAIYFSQDPNLRDYLEHKNPSIVHPNSPKLEAYYVRNEYQRIHGKTLPIFEYSALHNTICSVSDADFSDDSLINMWREMCWDYIEKKIQTLSGSIEVLNQSIDDIKVNALYGHDKLKHASILSKSIVPADRNYPLNLQAAINKEIEKIKASIRADDEKISLIIAAGIGDSATFQCLFQQQDFLAWKAFNINQLMFFACQNNNEEIINLLFTSHFKPFLMAENQYMGAAHQAANFNRVSYLNRLIKEGINLNARMPEGSTPLDFAVYSGSTDCVRILLDNKVNPNQILANDVSSLEYASILNYPDIVTLLLSRGVDCNTVNSQNNSTPILQAILGNAKNIMEELIKHGATIDKPIYIQSSRVLEELKEQYNEPMYNKCVDKLKALHADNLPAVFTALPLHVAAILGKTELVEYLLTQDITKNLFRHIEQFVGQDTVGALFISYAPNKCKKRIFDAMSQYLGNTQNIDLINAIINNNLLFKEIFIKHMPLAAAIAECYWQATGKAVVLKEPLRVYFNKLFLPENIAALNSMDGKIIGIEKDTSNRYECCYHESRQDAKLRIFNAKYLVNLRNQNLTKFNVDGKVLKKFLIQNTTWNFRK